MEVEISSVDFPFICRICLTRGELRLFEKEDCLWNLFLAISKIDVSSTVNFPRNVCDECINKLQDILVFIDVSKYNDPGSGKKLVPNTGSIEYPHTIGSETYQEVFEYKEEEKEKISDKIFQFCRICSSPRRLILCEEKSSLMDLFRTITNIDVGTDINSSSRSSICNKCVNELEKISSFRDLLFCNNGKLQKAISKNEALKTESDSDGNAFDVGLSRCEEIKVDLNEIKVEKSSDENACPHESNDTSALIDIKEEKFDGEFVTSIERKYQTRFNLVTQSQFGETTVDLQQLLLVHTGEKPFECDLCKKRFNRKDILKNHMLLHTGERPFKCDCCEKSFASKSTLRVHMLTHTGEQRFECDWCEKKFTQKMGVQQHIRTHTGERPFKCDFCEKQFTQRTSLKRHISTHTGEKPFECDCCEKSFVLKSLLKQHMLTHTGEKRFECDRCGKGFTQNRSLQQHILTHTGEKRFKCDSCEKRFTLEGHLKRHVLSHTGEKPFKCDNCENRYTQVYRLKQHKLIHTGEKVFK